MSADRLHALDDLIDRAAEVMINHTRVSIEACHCGWAELGKSHAEHVARALADAGLLATPEHDAAASINGEAQKDYDPDLS